MAQLDFDSFCLYEIF